MSPEERMKHQYLGDAVYAEWDGYHMILRTNDHRDSHCHAKIYLDISVLNSLFNFADRILPKDDHE